MKRFFPVLVLIVFTATSIYSQNGGLFSGGFIIGVPQREHADANDKLGFGFNLNGGYNFRNTPVTLGLDFNLFIMNSDERKEPFSKTIPDVRVDVTTTSNLINTNLYLRLQPLDGIVQPYIDILGGFNYLYTTTKIESENYTNDDTDDIASSTDWDDFAFAYGAGAGIMVPVFRQKKEFDEESGIQKEFFQFLIQGGAKYIIGGDAEYLKEGDKQITEDGDVIYNPTKSKTDLLHIFIGISLKF